MPFRLVGVDEIAKTAFNTTWFAVALQSDARKVPVETSVSDQLYDTLIIYAVTGKTIDLKINIGRKEESDR